MIRRLWTELELCIMRDLYPDVPSADVAALLDRPKGSIYQQAALMGLRKSDSFKGSDFSGRIVRGKKHPRMIATQFKPGMKPWNIGTHFVAGGRSALTRFTKGQRPYTWMPIGSYRITDNQLERKINDLPGANHVRWKSVHRLVWEAVNGPTPAGHICVFKPSAKTVVLELITIERVECISRAEHARRNHPRNISPEVAKLVQLKGAITRQVNRINKESQQRSVTT